MQVEKIDVFPTVLLSLQKLDRESALDRLLPVSKCLKDRPEVGHKKDTVLMKYPSSEFCPI
jgi:hypothetical protein